MKLVILGVFLTILSIANTAKADQPRIAQDGFEQLGSGKLVQCKRYKTISGVTGIKLSIKTVFQLQETKSSSRDSYFETNPDTGALEHKTGEPYNTVIGKIGTGGFGRSIPSNHELEFKNIQFICDELQAWVE